MKNPKLRNRLLLLFVQIGKLSVSMAEQYLQKHHHPEIIQSFRKLQSMGLIKKIHKNPGKGIPLPRGRPKEYYEITEIGLRYLIESDIQPERFWYLLIAYCHNYNDHKDISLASIRAFYSFFLTHYLKFSSAINLAFQLDYVNQMIDNWFKKNINKNKKVVKLDQKILETVALHPDISLEDLAAIINSSPDTVEMTLTKYLMINPKCDYEDFLQQCVIISKQDESEKVHYQLSLFGVLLVMTLIRRSQAGDNSLFYINLSIEEYYSALARNYGNKLPLILGKWTQIVKNSLMSWAEYNFDIILVDEKERSKVMSTPVIMGGNKDLYQNIRSLTLYNYKKIVEILEIGLSVYRKYKENKLDNNLSTNSENSIKSCKRIYDILRDVQASLVYLNPKDFLRDLYRQERKRKEYIGRQSVTLLGLRTAYDLLIMDFDLSSSNRSVIENLEKSLSNEITFLYYANLIDSIFYPVVHPNKGIISVCNEIMSQRMKMSPKPDYNDPEYHKQVMSIHSPKRRLLSLLNYDKEIREWFFSIMEDIIRYQNETSESISNIYKEVDQKDAMAERYS